MQRNELERALAIGEPIGEIAQRQGVRPAEVRRLIAAYGRPSVREMRRQLIAAAITDGSRTVTRRCKHHGETEFAIAGSQQSLKCKRCRSDAVARRRRKVKQMLVDAAGGRCVLCGFNTYLASLEFHHINPAEKSFGVAQRGITRAYEEVRREAEKCVLVCSNCHAAIEVGELTLPLELNAAIAPN